MVYSEDDITNERQTKACEIAIMTLQLVANSNRPYIPDLLRMQ